MYFRMRSFIVTYFGNIRNAIVPATAPRIMVSMIAIAIPALPPDSGLERMVTGLGVDGSLVGCTGLV